MEGLAELEAKYRVVALYRWLSLRMEELAAQCGREVTFPDKERAGQLSQQLSTLLNTGLPACVSRRRHNNRDRDRQGGGGGGGGGGHRDQGKPFDREAMMGRQAGERRGGRSDGWAVSVDRAGRVEHVASADVRAKGSLDGHRHHLVESEADRAAKRPLVAKLVVNGIVDHLLNAYDVGEERVTRRDVVVGVRSPSTRR